MRLAQGIVCAMKSEHAKRLAAFLATIAMFAASMASAETRFASFTFENDFFAGYDRHYTNGVQVAFLTPLDQAPQWLQSLSADPQMVVAFGQRIYTPSDKGSATPDPNDRPYAGWAYTMGDLRTRSAATIDHLSVTVGIVGPASGAKQTQNNVHHLIGDATAKGWDTQVRTKPTFMAGYERAWPEVWQGAFGTHRMDLGLRTGGNIGTPLTYVEAGAVARFGSHLPTDLPVTHVSLGPPRDGYRGTPQFGWYVWLGLDAHAVGYNEFVQGATFAGGPHVQRENFGTDVQLGVAAAWPRARVGFTFVQRSKEFRGQPGNDRYGQLAISVAY
jgi:lipid A 3-O-deacylase